MANPWLIHLKAFRAKHKGMSLTEAMKKAKATYKKGAKKDDKKKGKGTKKGGARKGQPAGSRLAYDQCHRRQ